ncbi:glutaminase [Dankookia sp. P2]|uniref:glutaminase n=1 Tax=Dankookia sp. P2 TaxID=3423955 RepID=UPI003D66C7C5
MHRLLHLEEAAGPAVVSTGRLPDATAVDGLVRAARERYAPIAEGKVADYIPALAVASPDWFGLCVAGVDGTLHAAGEADRAFSIQSISKPFVFALVCQALGGGRARRASASTRPACPSTPSWRSS